MMNTGHTEQRAPGTLDPFPNIWNGTSFGSAGTGYDAAMALHSPSFVGRQAKFFDSPGWLSHRRLSKEQFPAGLDMTFQTRVFDTSYTPMKLSCSLQWRAKFSTDLDTTSNPWQWTTDFSLVVDPTQMF